MEYGGTTSFGGKYVNKPRQEWGKLAEIADSIMYDNPIANAYQEAIPANIRFAVGNLLHPGVITERNFSKKELDTIRQMVDNMESRVYSSPDKYYEAVANMKNANSDDEMVYNPMNNRYQQAGMVGDMLNYPRFKGVTYADMTTNQGTYDPYIYKKGYKDMIKSSFDNPVANIQTAIGQFYPTTNSKGQIEIDDVYDFRKVGDRDWAGKEYKFVHKLLEDLGTPVQMNIRMDRY